MSANDVYIYDALRTPRGKGKAATQNKPGGALSNLEPHQLVAQLVHELSQRNRGLENQIESFSLGCVGQVGVQGGHIALASRIASGLPNSISTSTVNNYCVSSLTAIGMMTDKIAAGADGLHVAGGVECLSQVGFLADKASFYSDPKLGWMPPIMGAELIATLEGFSKVDLDEISLLSHQRAHAAWQAGHYEAGVMSALDEQGKVLLARDELIRNDISQQSLEEMKPAFAEQGAQGFDQRMLQAYPNLDSISHVHSFANCPGMADGAALVIAGDYEAGIRAELTPKAKIVAKVETADDPVLQLTAGMKATEKLLFETGLKISDFDRIEFFEAFAAVPLKFIRDFKPDMDKLNVNGGHLAMGHPMGATGAILLTTLVHELQRCDGQLGLVIGQAGGGIGSAMIIERQS